MDASQAEILERFGQQRLLIIEFDSETKEVSIPHGTVVKEETNKLWIAFNRNQISAFDLIATLERDKGIIDVSIKEETIESIVTQIYESGMGEG